MAISQPPTGCNLVMDTLTWSPPRDQYSAPRPIPKVLPFMSSRPRSYYRPTACTVAVAPARSSAVARIKLKGAAILVHRSAAAVAANHERVTIAASDVSTAPGWMFSVPLQLAI